MLKNKKREMQRDDHNISVIKFKLKNKRAKK